MQADDNQTEADLLDQDLSGMVVFLHQDELSVPAAEHPFLVTRDFALTLDGGAMGGVFLSDGEIAWVPRVHVERIADEGDLTNEQRAEFERALRRDDCW